MLANQAGAGTSGPDHVLTVAHADSRYVNLKDNSVTFWHATLES